MLEKILQLGHPLLYQKAKVVDFAEIDQYKKEVELMLDLILEFRKKYNKGRGIAAPQIGLLKRIVCYNVDEPIVMYNPSLSNLSEEKFELWDDCMSFPNLLVKVRRHKSCTLTFYNSNWELQKWDLKDDLSELFQHECDHLDGILATQRAINQHAFKYI
jgi:peptide deformylase